MTPQEMIDKGPEWLDAYLQRFEGGELAPHSMISIEAGAASKAHSESSIRWAEIAVRAAELLALENRGEHRAHALRKAMSLRAWFISKRGAEADHPILDPQIVVRWFKNEAEYPLSAVEEKSLRLRATKLSAKDQDELIKLRNIKGRIGVLRTLADAGELPPDPELQEWLNMRDRII